MTLCGLENKRNTNLHNYDVLLFLEKIVFLYNLIFFRWDFLMMQNWFWMKIIHLKLINNVYAFMKPLSEKASRINVALKNTNLFFKKKEIGKLIQYYWHFTHVFHLAKSFLLISFGFKEMKKKRFYLAKMMTLWNLILFHFFYASPSSIFFLSNQGCISTFSYSVIAWYVLNNFCHFFGPIIKCSMLSK